MTDDKLTLLTRIMALWNESRYRCLLSTNLDYHPQYDGRDGMQDADEGRQTETNQRIGHIYTIKAAMQLLPKKKKWTQNGKKLEAAASRDCIGRKGG